MNDRHISHTTTFEHLGVNVTQKIPQFSDLFFFFLNNLHLPLK